MRRLLRNFVEHVAVRSGITAFARWTNRNAIAVVAYHNVVPLGESARGDSSLHLPLHQFIRQIERLSETHEIADLRDLAGSPRRGGGTHSTGRAGRPRAVITFDDAYQGAVSLALPELTTRGIPAVVFVAPALLGNKTTWWDELAEAGLLSPQARTAGLQKHRGEASAIRDAYLRDRKLPDLPPSYRIATRGELLAQLGDTVSVGSHAWGHEYLPGLCPAELRGTLTRSLQWVRDLGNAACPWLALPYGGGSPALGQQALELGYAGVLRIEGGLWQPHQHPDFLPRINVPAGLSALGLELWTSGLR